MSIIKIAIVSDTLRKVVNITKYNDRDIPQDEGDLKYVPTEDWMSPNIEFAFNDDGKRVVPQSPYEEIVDGKIAINEVKKAEHEAKKAQSIKAQLENGAYSQQDKYLDPNTNQLFWASVDKDLTSCPKMTVYKTFMDALWLKYHIRKEGLTEDFDFTSITPSSEYSFSELREEMQNL